MAAGVLLSGCTDDVLLVGAKPEAATDPSDASSVQDASENDANNAGDEAPPPLKARFKANGRLGVVRVEPCASECVEVSVVVEGGVPPYDIVWDNGKVGASQTLCEERSRVPSVVVSDARPGGGGAITLGLNTVRSRGCPRSGQGFLTCFVPEVKLVECAGGRREVFALGEFVGPSQLTVEFGYDPTGPGQAPFYVDAVFSETVCPEDSQSWAWPVDDVSGETFAGIVATNSQEARAFLSFAGASLFEPVVNVSLGVTWIEACEQATTFERALGVQ